MISRSVRISFQTDDESKPLTDYGYIDQSIAFDVVFPNKESFDRYTYWVLEQGGGQDFSDQIETKFGSMDWNADPDSEIIGYVTAEVAIDHRMKLMQEWHDYFTDKGFTCGPIIEIK